MKPAIVSHPPTLNDVMSKKVDEDYALEQIKKFKKSGDNQDLLPVFKFLSPQINKRVSQFSAATINPLVLNNEARKILAGELDKFDPKQSSLSTFAHDRLRRLQRFVITYQNPVRMPENITLKIGLYREAYDGLKQNVGREPSTIELADELQWTPRQVSTMEAYLNKLKNIIPDDTDTVQVYDPEADKIELSYMSMKPQEQVVFDNLTGSHGKKKISGLELSKKLKMPYSSIRSIKGNIKTTLEGLR